MLNELRVVVDKLRDAGHDIVCCVMRHDEEGAHYSTRLSLGGTQAEQDQHLFDALREISMQWSNARVRP